jgi:DNA-binding response OmpR family regulator
MLTWSTMLRRQPRPLVKTEGPAMEGDGVVLDVSRRRAHVDGHVVHLPAREAAALALLIAHAGQVVDRAALTEAVWGTEPAHHNDLDRLIRRLHRRIQPSPLSPARLRRVGDTGYTFGSAPD